MSPFKKLLTIIIDIICWGLVAFLLLMAVAGLPSIASLLFLFAAVLLVPIRAVKNFIGKFLPQGWLKVGFAIVFFCTACMIYPLSDTTEEANEPDRTTISGSIPESEPSGNTLRAEPETETEAPETTAPVIIEQPVVVPVIVETPETEPQTEVQPETEPPVRQEPENIITYVLNTNTKKIHYADCDSVEQMADKNRAETTDYAKAIADGYEPCKNCNP